MVSVEGAERTDSGSLFHWAGMQEQNVPAPTLVLTLGTNRRIFLWDLHSRDGSDVASIVYRQTGCFSRRVSSVIKQILRFILNFTGSHSRERKRNKESKCNGGDLIVWRGPVCNSRQTWIWNLNGTSNLEDRQSPSFIVWWKWVNCISC